MKRLVIAFSPENAQLFSLGAFNRYLAQVYEYLQVLENRLYDNAGLLPR